MKTQFIYKILIGCVAIALISWDLSTSLNNAVEEGTYRYESDFDAISGATTKVAIVRSDETSLTSPVSRTSVLTYDQVEDMVAKAIELQGGFGYVVDKGDNVLIKVNLVGGSSSSGDGENTDVRVVKALVKLLNDHAEGDITITIAEGTARTNDNPAAVGSVWDNSGYKALLTDNYLSGINFSLLNLNQSYSDLVTNISIGKNATAATHGDSYCVHKAELEADVYISVPVLKIHDTGLTCALKNQIGTAPGAYYGYNKTKGTSYHDGLVHDVNHRRWTTEEIVDLCTIADIDFVVVDALMTLELKKSYVSSNKVRMNTIIAGVDPVAVDHVCAKLFCLNPDDIAHITLAEKVNLGTNDPDKIEIVGNSISSTKKKVKKNQDANGKFGQSNRTWILSQAYSGSDISTEFITNESSYIAAPGVDGWSQPVYFFDDRIDLKSYYNDQTSIITYAFTQFSSPKAQTAELWFGCHEAVKIYLNGEEVYGSTSLVTYNEDKYTITNRDVINISLKAGENTLMVKTLNKYGDYSFALNICEVESNTYYAGNRVTGLKFYINEATGVEDLTENINNDIKVSVAPSPARYSAVVYMDLPKTADTEIRLYDMSGKIIISEYLGTLPSGKNKYIWNLRNTNNIKVPSGTYVGIIKSGNIIKDIKIAVSN